MKTSTVSFTCLLTVLLGASSALAADLPMKAAPLSAPTAAGWTGFYFGVNGGYGIGSASVEQSSTFTSTALGTNTLLNRTGHNTMTGALLGGQIGYNLQLGAPWLIGVEADWQWTSQKGSSAVCTPPAGTVAFFGAGANGLGYCLADQQKIRDFGTLRARGGAILNDSLWYATGGLAWGSVKDSAIATSSSNPVIFPGFGSPVAGAGSFSSTQVGWTVGAGVETKLTWWRGWSAKFEYLHVDLGSRTETIALAINPAFGAAFTTGGVATATSRTKITDDVIRIGLNYQWGSWYATR